MPITLLQKPTISEGDIDVAAIDYTDYLDAGETLTGAVTLAEQGTNHLTFSNNVVNTTLLYILGDPVAIGAAVQFKVENQKAGVLYRVRVTVATTAIRTCIREILINVT